MLGMVEPECKRDDKIARETRCSIGSIGLDAQTFAGAARGHWGIANILHWASVGHGEPRRELVAALDPFFIVGSAMTWPVVGLVPALVVLMKTPSGFLVSRAAGSLQPPPPQNRTCGTTAPAPRRAR